MSSSRGKESIVHGIDSFANTYRLHWAHTVYTECSKRPSTYKKAEAFPCNWSCWQSWILNGIQTLALLCPNYDFVFITDVKILDSGIYDEQIWFIESILLKYDKQILNTCERSIELQLVKCSHSSISVWRTICTFNYLIYVRYTDSDIDRYHWLISCLIFQ